MRHGSLFSGIGGFDLAAEWMGWENVFHCEWMPFPRQVLHHYWPNAISYEDITKTDFTIHRGNIDLISGGFPCQPYSTAGKRLGKADERHLWPEMRRAIQEIEPRWIVGENVRGLVNWSGGMVFEEVCADLENCGYEVQPMLLPACAVNAPHRRDRIWFVAHSNNNGAVRTSRRDESDGNQKWLQERDEIQFSDKSSELYDAADTNEKRLQFERGSAWMEGRRFSEYNSQDDDANTNFKRLQGSKNVRSIGKSWEKSNQFTAGYFCQNWENFPTQSPICGGDDGLPRELDRITFSKWRNESIKGYGNTVVPQVVYQIFKAIEAYDNSHHPVST